MFHALLAVAAVMLAPGMAQAEETKLDAAFVGDGTYSPTTGCKKLEDIQNGKDAPNIATYPLTLTREGTGSWEGGCNFAALREVKSNVFEGKMQCSEGAEEYAQTVTFTRLDADRIEVRSGTEALVYERCKGLKGKVER
ncbi:hypothetical protein RLW55_19290 [Hyphomicrobium sp. B1]|uniref:hypothetical protein n=1 Tax=unclassified Hyphomicrobium TaxID=2619925 RepID=UPI0039C09971